MAGKKQISYHILRGLMVYPSVNRTEGVCMTREEDFEETIRFRHGGEPGYILETELIGTTEITSVFSSDYSLDYVIISFENDEKSFPVVSSLIALYREKDAVCCIGCVKDVEEKSGSESADERTIKKLTTQFDLFLTDASDRDVAEVIQFCISTEESTVCVDAVEMKQTIGRRCILLTAESDSIEELTGNLTAQFHQYLDELVKPLEKCYVSFMTNGYELPIFEVQQIVDIFEDCSDESTECCLNFWESMPDLGPETVKAIMLLTV